jgi:hypothetical protein
MKKWQTKQWFAFTAVFAFASFISFINIGSSFGDENNFNGIIGFTGIGILSALVSVFGLYKSSKKSS